MHDMICPPACAVWPRGCDHAFVGEVFPCVPARRRCGFFGELRSCRAGACAPVPDFALAVATPGILPGYPLGDEAIARTSTFCSRSARHVHPNERMLPRCPILARPGWPCA